MGFTRFACTALVLTWTGLSPGGVANAGSLVGGGIAHGIERAAGGGFIRVGSSRERPTQTSPAEAENAVLGTWRGRWTRDISSGEGDVTIIVERAQGGTLAGKGEATGGECSGDFSMSGWYRGSQVEMTLEFPASSAQCPAGTVGISLRMGKTGDVSMAVGSWADKVEGVSKGRGFGLLEITKQ